MRLIGFDHRKERFKVDRNQTRLKERNESINNPTL